MKTGSYFKGSVPLSITQLSRFGELIRLASESLSSYSPRLDRDVSELSLENSVQLGGPWNGVLGDTPGGDWQLLYLGGDLRIPKLFGDELGGGRVTALGAHDYERLEIEDLRRSQRVLPSAEMDWDVAFRTAASELQGQAVVVSLNINLLLGPFGLPPHIFLRDLRGLQGVTRLQIWSETETPAHADVGAACLREALLSWW